MKAGIHRGVYERKQLIVIPIGCWASQSYWQAQPFFQTAVLDTYVPFFLLSLALAAVIYTPSLTPSVAVVWSGLCNFLGVLLSSGVVAFGIISLLPVELILQAGGGGFAMVYALLFFAIIWNLGT